MDSLAGWISLSSVAVGLGVYVSVSTILYYCPIQSRKASADMKKSFHVISHRGGSGENMENTMQAFEHSKDIGVDIIETDCQLTRDGQVVLCHDNDLSRVCGVNKLISDLNYDELPQLIENLNTEISFDSKSNFAAEKCYGDSDTQTQKFQIPLLEDLFKLCPQTRINIDIKFHSDELIRKVHDLIVKYEREHITIWGSFNETVTQKCYKMNRKIDVYFSMKGTLKLLLLTITGLLPFVRLKETHFEIVLPNFLKVKLPFLIKLGIFLVKIVFIRKSFIRHLQKRGIEVYFWVLNNEDEFKYAMDLDANGIITDYPTRLIAFVNNRKQEIITPLSQTKPKL